jgi:hypothetical protein
MGSNTNNEKDVLVCERISGSMGFADSPLSANLPVNTARPSTADTPHKNAAEPMKKYPRSGCGFVWMGWEEFRIRSPNSMMKRQ